MLACLEHAAGNATNQRLDDFKGYIEARLGKPSHLLEGDKLRQFLENNKRVGQGGCCLLLAELVSEREGLTLFWDPASVTFCPE